MTTEEWRARCREAVKARDYHHEWATRYRQAIEIAHQALLDGNTRRATHVLGQAKRDADATATRPTCDHKFMDSQRCAKCGVHFLELQASRR